MMIIWKTMLRGLFRDAHTLVLTIMFPVAILIGLGMYLGNPSYNERLLAGVLAMNVLFGSTMVTAFNVMAHRNRGVYKLLRVTPFSIASFISAMIGARTVLTLLVSFILIGVGSLMFHVTISITSLFLLVISLIIGTICLSAIGFFAANLSRDESNVNMISNLLSFPMLFTSEAFYSLEHAPAWVQVVSQLQPFSYFVDAMSAAITSNGVLLEVVPSLAILAGFTVLCLLAAVFTFRWDTEASAFGMRKRMLS